LFYYLSLKHFAVYGKSYSFKQKYTHPGIFMEGNIFFCVFFFLTHFTGLKGI
jgi:hypothetical protein